MTTAESVGTAEQAQDVRLPAPVRIVLTVLVLSALVMMLNETILSVALPAIMADFSIPATTAQWLTTGFMLTMAVMMPTTGWLLQRFSTRAIFLTATVFFLVGTLIAALAPSFPVLLGGRIIQAVGTALIMPLLMTVAMTVVPAQRRGSIMGIISIVMSVAPALGPTVSGIILNNFTWHALFWFMVPLVAIATVVGGFFIRNVGETRSTPLDVLSVILSAFAFGGLVYGLSSIATILEGGQAARTAATVLVVGVIALVIFVWRQLSLGRRDRALLDLRPFRIRNFTVSVVSVLLVMGAMLGVVSVLPLYLQGSLLITALVTGLVLMPGGLLQGLISPFIGRFYDNHGPRPLLIPGMLIIVATLFWLSTIDETTPLGLVVTMHICFSIGMALVMTPLMSTALGSLPAQLYGHGSAILNTLQQLAGATGTAVLIATFTRGTESSAAAGAGEAAALGDGASTAFLVAGSVAVVAFICSLFVTRLDTRSGGNQTKVVPAEDPR